MRGMLKTHHLGLLHQFIRQRPIVLMTRLILAKAMTSVGHPQFYGRYASPNTRQVQETVAALEGGEAALALSSGDGGRFAGSAGQSESRGSYGGPNNFISYYLQANQP